MAINVSLSNPRHLAAAQAMWQRAVEGATLAEFVQMQVERMADSWRDSTRSDAIPTAAFIRRFSPTAYATIVAASAQSPELQAYLARLDAEPLVWLGADETIAGVGALVAAGLLTQGDADALLAYGVPTP